MLLIMQIDSFFFLFSLPSKNAPSVLSSIISKIEKARLTCHSAIAQTTLFASWLFPKGHGKLISCHFVPYIFYACILRTPFFFSFPFSWFRVLTLLSRVGDPLGRNKISKEIYLAVFVCQVDQISNMNWISSTHFLPHCVCIIPIPTISVDQSRMSTHDKSTRLYLWAKAKPWKAHIKSISFLGLHPRDMCRVVIGSMIWEALLTCVCVTLMWYESLKFLGISTLKS